MLGDAEMGGVWLVSSKLAWFVNLHRIFLTIWIPHLRSAEAKNFAVLTEHQGYLLVRLVFPKYLAVLNLKERGYCCCPILRRAYL